MQHWRCKCGAAWAWGSMPPDPKQKCWTCGSKMEWVPDPPPTRGDEYTPRPEDLPRDRFGNIAVIS